jgi:histidinol-phosphate/aromatic aminotransferase/cobyric acid decarboxylase-like protein
VWIDETYVDYVGSEQSLEGLASRSRQIVVCKSMSKVYALSGLRAAYLCGPPDVIADLRALTPPWAVGLPAQVAAVRALEEGDYYRQRYAETHRLRERLRQGIVRLGLDPVPGVANFLLVHLPEIRDRGNTASPATGAPWTPAAGALATTGAPATLTAPALLARCRARGLFLRDTASLSRRLQDRAFRIAVKDAATIPRMLAILRDELRSLGAVLPSTLAPGTAATPR